MKLNLMKLSLQDTDNDALKNVLKANAEKPVKMVVYSSKTGNTRGMQ